jgi:hypothetical protein
VTGDQTTEGADLHQAIDLSDAHEAEGRLPNRALPAKSSRERVGTGGRVLKLFLQITDAAGHQQLASVVEHHDMLIARSGLDSFDSVEINNDGSTDAQKQTGRQLGFKVSQRFAQDVIFAASL